MESERQEHREEQPRQTPPDVIKPPPILVNVEIAFGFEESDRPRLAEIAWSAYGDKMGWIYRHRIKDGIHMMQYALIPETTIVARLDGVIVGYLAFSTTSSPKNTAVNDVVASQHNWRSIFLSQFTYQPTPGELYIGMLAVSPEGRGSGIGTQLLRSIYAYSQQHSFPTISLHVTLENIAAKKLYLREGFLEIQRYKMCCCLPYFYNYALTGSYYMRKSIALQGELVTSGVAQPPSQQLSTSSQL